MLGTDYCEKMALILIVIAGVAAGGWWLREQRTARPGNAQTGRPTSAKAESRDIHFAINAAGEIGPADQVSVRPEVNGRILHLPVDIGDTVKKGTVVSTG